MVSEAAQSSGNGTSRVHVGTANLRPWAKGQSGNPGGRSRAEIDIAKLCRAHTAEAVEALVKALKTPRYRVAAAMGLLAYGYGKPLPITDENAAHLERRIDSFVLNIVSVRQDAPRTERSDVHGSNGARMITVDARPSADGGTT